MPGAGIIGSRYANPNNTDASKSSLLPAETRNLSRLLRLIGDPDEAATVLAACAKGKKLNGYSFLVDLEQELCDLRRKNNKQGWVENTEIEMAKAVERAFESRNKKVAQRKTSPISKPGPKSDDTDDDAFLISPPPPTTIGAVQTILLAPQAPLISDDSEGAVEEEEETRVSNVDQELAVMDFWAHLLEHVHLHVTSKTIRTWGRKKIYEVYRLVGPTLPVTNMEEIRFKVRKEFLAFYDGTTDCGKTALRYSDCRVYVMQSEDHYLWIQINIGRSFDPTDEVQRSKTGGKKRKAATEFVAMIPPESSLVALTASRAASRSRFTPYVLSALETALTCSVVGGYCARDAYSQRLEDLSGADPHELLRSAQAVEVKNAVGRFASYATAESSWDPISELHSAATASLLDRQNEKQRLAVGAKHGRKLANLSTLVASKGQASLVASNQAGTRTIVDCSSQEHRSRKRARDEEFGSGEKDLPVRTCVRWDWKGETTAAAACWHQGVDSSSTTTLATHKFKCRVTMQGKDVFAGMRALMAAGFMKGPLPHYVKDAASLGDGGSITVDHGAVRTRVDKHSG